MAALRRLLTPAPLDLAAVVEGARVALPTPAALATQYGMGPR